MDLREEAKGRWRKVNNELHNCPFHQIFLIIKSKWISWAGGDKEQIQNFN
jgi:hypothetical protein